MSETKKNYAQFLTAIDRYAGDGVTWETYLDGVLEYLVVTERLNPEEFEGWPEDGLVAPLLRDAQNVSA